LNENPLSLLFQGNYLKRRHANWKKQMYQVNMLYQQILASDLDFTEEQLQLSGKSGTGTLSRDRRISILAP